MLDRKAFKKTLMPAAGLGLTALLSGCDSDKLVLLNPQGWVGVQEKSLIITATVAMLIVVVPVILLTLLFAWRYRASNRNATYAPKWSHSTLIEAVVWFIPGVIILFLAVLTWKTSHELDPYKPIPQEVSAVKPIEVQVVALDWKWLFIYPEQKIASVNELVVPAGTPVNFYVTSDAVMNSFFIPQLGSQVYAMAGMQTRLHLIADHPGTYAGISANYSGRGFSDMTFKAIATKDQSDFNDWVNKVKASSTALSMDEYSAKLLPQSEKNRVEYFSSVDPNLFQNIVMKYNVGNQFRGFQDPACITTGTKG